MIKLKYEVNRYKEKRKLEEKRKEVGFIERNTNKDYNIVYRNKPSKPMTVSELFGLKTPKQEPKEEKVLPVSETEENKTISKQEEKEEQDCPACFAKMFVSAF